jgi:hypothetical protein
VVGSYAELGGFAGTLPEGFDPHKPLIDEVTWPCDCGGTMRRTPEVVDVWFDSGAMPYAQWHYPFENETLFQRHFPADFICEGVDQTRGWFYSLMAISTHAGFRTGVPPRGGERPGARRRRSEDVEVARQRGGPVGSHRAVSGPMRSAGTS